jgi:hypothetical protein
MSTFAKFVTALAFLACASAGVPGAAQTDETTASASMAPTGEAIDGEIAGMMQMMRDEGIDIDARMEDARSGCRTRLSAEEVERSAEELEEAIANCTLVEQQIVYARGINELNANRQSSFAQAMAAHKAELAEAERKQRQYQREVEERDALIAAQAAGTAPATSAPGEEDEPTPSLAAATETQTQATPPAAKEEPLEPIQIAESDRSGSANETRGETSLAAAPPSRQPAPIAARPAPRRLPDLVDVSSSGPRIALVIGNEDYFNSMGELNNPVNDAVLIGATLRRLGFDVEILTDASQREMKEAVQRLGDRLLAAGNDATGLFYYAGHGVQSKGVNFLIPVGSVIDAENDLELEAVSADAVLAQMEDAFVSTRIVILDACRNMPLRRRARNGVRGLARMDTPNGSFLAYSTSPGNVADDGNGIHSPFAEALAEQMLVPDRPIEVTFREVRKQVVEMTNGNQVPWDASSLLDTFSFASGG